MSLTAAHLRELMSLGIEGEALVRTVEIMEEASDLSSDASAMSADMSADIGRGPLESTASEALKKRRNADKLAKRAKRAAAKLSAKTSADKADMSADKTLSASVVLSSSLLPEEPLKKARGSENARARGTRLAPGTPLSDQHRAIIVAEGITRDPEKFWEEFVNYWSEVPGRHGVKLGWTGTLRNRCREVIKRGNNGNRTGNTRTTGHDAILAAATRAAGKIVGDGAMAGAGGSPEFPERNGSDGSRAARHAGQEGCSAADRHGSESGSGGVLEGEIIAPDKTAAGLSDSRQFL